ncbi:hypothetical protein BCR44DRAFT_1424199 [Catenaria anguillulae PL171]|uniref:Uncharacterized protein n=1 Tax=Catenaria anguillulae PL171 TaxID=765915 RepID=A0A1Y2I2C7_9FUNG|nr:hypothetical protein BCR44DRAFT_1424199 [Catenaria anguillulae PL171]
MVQYIITTTFATLTTMLVQLCFFLHKVQIVFLETGNKPYTKRSTLAAVSGIDYDDAVATMDYSQSAGGQLSGTNTDGNDVMTGLRCKYCRQVISVGSSISPQTPSQMGRQKSGAASVSARGVVGSSAPVPIASALMKP